jgi:hypothetical protein
MSEAWGVESDDHALDFARRVDEFLEAQQFESGLGSLDELPDIVREVWERAERVKNPPLIPWQDVMRDYLRKAQELPTEERVREFLKYPYLGPVIFADDTGIRVNPQGFKSSPYFGTNEKDKTYGLAPPVVNRFIAVGPDTSGSISPEDAKVFFDEFDPPSKGKSEMLREMCEAEGIEVEEITLSSPAEHPEDWLGIPITSEEHREELRAKLDSGEIGHHRAMFFFDEYISMPRDKYEAMIAINKAMNPERDNGVECERDD